ncbi:hypothetical protein AKJ51_04700 [candidate division MSBL1 archaeon SCGC-AAA382A20]|uniref:Uncharacterized protein n=1 Tax=candidate division MSBL1 archaeon SCGC-AAA382A20 TaxID=1698280 RepID=A0A133VHB8_9EURY|nr:hypothetical protein AKJ51_04700 [candidate division MSBL1 archaeon SCGC-AAA382A20]
MSEKPKLYFNREEKLAVIAEILDVDLPCLQGGMGGKYSRTYVTNEDIKIILRKLIDLQDVDYEKVKRKVKERDKRNTLQFKI